MDPQILIRVMEELIPFNKFLGVKVALSSPERVRLEIPFRPELVGDQLRPALHGGVLSTLADAAGGMALWAQLQDPTARVSTIDLRIDYLRPAKLETIVCEAVVVRLGKRVGVVDMRLFQPSAEKESVATGKGVYNIKVLKKA
jgi:uncharacterized protein (TIGR00369 family)